MSGWDCCQSGQTMQGMYCGMSAFSHFTEKNAGRHNHWPAWLILRNTQLTYRKLTSGTTSRTGVSSLVANQFSANNQKHDGVISYVSHVATQFGFVHQLKTPFFMPMQTDNQHATLQIFICQRHGPKIRYRVGQVRC